MTRSIFLFTLLVFLFSGCSARKCGIDEDAFKMLSQIQKDQICSDYAKNEQYLAVIRAEEAKARAQKEAIEAANESENIRRAYHGSSFAGAGHQIIDVEIVGGVLRYNKRDYHIASNRFSLVEREAKKITITSYDDRYSNPTEDIWVSYQNHRLLIGVYPDSSKSHLRAYLNNRDDFYFGNPIEIVDNGFMYGRFYDIEMNKNSYARSMKIFVKARR